MLSKTTFQEISTLLKDEKILNAFEYYKNKYSDLLFLKYNDEAVFAFTKNKNDVYEGQTYFLKTENANAIFTSLKTYLNARFIPYVSNKNRQEIFDKIDESLFYLKMHNYVLTQKLEEKPPVYEIIDAKQKDDLSDFYISCFEAEFDENAKIWLRDFELMEPQLEKGSKIIKIENEIAASIMYWVFENSIFIFLLGTNPKFRRRKLAYSLIFELQNQFSNKELSLTTWAETDTEKFYLSIGFQKMRMVNSCI